MQYQLFIGNYESVIGCTAYVKTNKGYFEGVVSGYIFGSRRYLIKINNGGECYTDKIYLPIAIN